MKNTKTNFLTKRLYAYEGPNWSLRNKETLYDFYRKNPIEAYKLLDKNIIVDKMTITVKTEALDFNYIEFLRFKSLSVGRMIGWNDGVIFERTK